MLAKEFFYDLGKEIYNLDAIYADFAKKSEVPPTLLWVLYALNDNKEHTQIEIIRSWDLPKSTVNTIIKDLESRNMLTLIPIKGKRREMKIVLTNNGQVYANKILKDLYKIEAELFSTLNKEDLKILNILRKIRNFLNQKIL